MTTKPYDDPVIPQYWDQPILRHLTKLQDMSNVQGVSNDIQTQIQICIDCIKAREDYCDDITSLSSTAIENLVYQTNQQNWQQVYDRGDIQWKVGPGMLTGELEGNFLKTLVSMSNAKRVLEVGLFTGNSALAMAEALPVDGKVVALEISEYIGKFARKLMDESPHGKKIDIQIGPAKDNMEKLAQEGHQFDIVFIDANKEGYMDYYKIIMDNNMLSPRGTILIDNALHGGMAYLSPENALLPGMEAVNMVITKFNEYVYNDDRVSQVMIPIRDGVLAIRRKDEFEGEM
ncbi:probable caffeoyl-CoA O-methyltransferase 1 isoform X2 [Pecten maximus]|nr:probable caffeoyl-CoA O-methyltransferase 1 isoform X2 [Pecten maximus]XP_033735964.1 probable caffeoyl-CoA O-methyltransferase 1 isoform X2 [Pecten maximus]